MRRRFVGAAIAFWTLCQAAALGLEGPCRQSVQLSDRLETASIEALSAVDALIGLGRQNGICLGIEDPDLALLTKPVALDAGSTTLREVLAKLLSVAPAYAPTIENGVVLIRRKKAPPSQLDVKIPDYTVSRLTMPEAELALHIRLQMLADPHIRGIAGVIHHSPYDQTVGPLSERGRTVRELLTKLVSASGGGAWITGNRRPSDATPCWTILQFNWPYEHFSQRLTFAISDLISEQMTRRPRPARDNPIQ